MTLAERIARPGPKRLLSLDGGGIRGLISVEILAAMEEQLRRQLGAGADFVLADYFDYIAGTSTGGIIATLLSLGWPVAKIRTFYTDHGREMFQRALAPWRLYRSLYREAQLSATLRDVIGADTPLGSDKLRTLLLLVMRNATTDSPWPISNNPAARYNDAALEDCNLALPLWKLARASTAAPLFFPPEQVLVGKTEFTFVDGGMTSYNNPAFLLFLMATIAPYRLCWPTGEERLLLVSVGTGTNPRPITAQAQSLFGGLLSVLMDPRFASLVQQDFLCRVFGACRAGGSIDGEVGDLRDGAASGLPKLFSYVRYNAELSRRALDQLGLADVDPHDVSKLDSVAHVEDLGRVGRAVAAQEIRAEHFQGFL